MLPRKKRVNKTLFGEIIAKGAYVQSPHFTFRYTRLSTQASQKEAGRSSQFSFVASKKIAKTAVGRNALRRRGYAALASIWSEKVLTHKTPLLGLIFIKKGTDDMKFSEYKAELAELFRKLV